jgi:tetratricopeptide (TPR) repeat protein
MSQDYYEILQVHPRADQEAVAAAHARLRDLYSPAKLEGAAPELAELARTKRDAIEHAYAVLGDPARRASYDAEQAALHDHRPPTTDHREQANAGQRLAVVSRQEEPALDYRPLPPARRAERARDFEAYPKQAPVGGRRAQAPTPKRIWLPLLGLAGLSALIVAISVALTSGAPTTASITPTASPLDAYESEIVRTRELAEQNPTDAGAWIEYGNMLYNSATIVRENQPDSQLYQQRLPRWLQATEAYTRALALDPNSGSVRSDLGVSACFYGAGINDQSFVRSGIAEARRALQALPNDARALLNLGHCLVSAQPPQTQEAIDFWEQVIASAPPGSPLALQAQQLIATYEQ